MSYNGWMIPDEERERILAQFPPAFPIVKATHVTSKLDEDRTLPMDADVVVVGYANDGGVEALVVAVDGTIFRDDGLIYHITLSLDEGRASKESNDVIARGYRPMARFGVETRAFFSFGEGPYVVSPLTAR